MLAFWQVDWVVRSLGWHVARQFMGMACKEAPPPGWQLFLLTPVEVLLIPPGEGDPEEQGRPLSASLDQA